MSRTDDIDCIRAALEAAARLIARTDLRRVEIAQRTDDGVTTALDHAINDVLFEHLRPHGDGWLSEENEDNLARLDARRVWVVDPIDGTREFVEGVPEWCVSVGLIENHQVSAGGVLNPSTGELFLGSLETGLSVVNAGNYSTFRDDLPRVLVSRREYKNGNCKQFESNEFTIKPVGSIAYRLALVAAGYASATCTLEPRSEWDVAAGVALLRAASGQVEVSSGKDLLLFNQPNSTIHGCLAFASDCPSSIREHFWACAKGQAGRESSVVSQG